ncbi:hypothetical protein A0H81_02373 [Grifola frondosa]|uniref:C2H2-type domain-containing protein n=1 Tax=Grifola frondosa TaxID=5627 RepID=A0A1C7MLD1_GRIFR|nr:hypothetical protein A0H81_02373 [Grifola frondosa]
MNTSLLFSDRLNPVIDLNHHFSSLSPVLLFDARRTAQQGITAASTAPRRNIMGSFASQVSTTSSQDIARWQPTDHVIRSSLSESYTVQEAKEPYLIHSPLYPQSPLYATYGQASAMRSYSNFPFDSSLTEILSGAPYAELPSNLMNIHAGLELSSAFAVQNTNGYQRIIPHQNPTASRPTDYTEIRGPSIMRRMGSSSVRDATYSLPSDLAINTPAVVYDIHPSRCQWGDACDTVIDDLSARGIIHHLKARHFPDKHWIGHRGPCQWGHCGIEMDFLSYGKHVETVHLRRTTVTCDRCTKPYTRPDSLKRHQKRCG